MQWQWENATAGAVAGFTTVAALHPLDVVRTRFQVNDGRYTQLPHYKHTPHALFSIARAEIIYHRNRVWHFLSYVVFEALRITLAQLIDCLEARLLLATEKGHPK